jgi:hypothetical protein
MGDEISKTKIDIKDVKTPLQWFAVFLLIVESLFLFWLFKAESAIERIFAGALAVSVLIAILIVVFYLTNKDKFSTPQADGLSSSPLKVNPETQTPTPSLMPISGQIIGPDKSYTINKPPNGWKTQEYTLEEMMSQSLNITSETIQDAIPQFNGPEFKVRDILRFTSPKSVSIIPVPGITTINGAKFPTALEIPVSSSLTILPLNHYSSPNFIKNPFIHKYINFVGQTISTGIIALTRFEVQSNPISKQTIRLAQCRQEIRNAIIDGEDGKNIDSNIVIYGIEGETQEHLILINYLSIPEGKDPTQDNEILSSLYNSFIPHPPINPDEKRKEIDNQIDQNLKKLIANNGKQLFSTEFNLVMGKICDWDIENPELRLKAIKSLKPFKAFAEYVNVKDENLEKLWETVDLAEKGNANPFKEQIEERRKQIIFLHFVKTIKTISTWDPDNLEMVSKAINLIKPFKQSIEKIDTEADFAKMWESIDFAEKGNLNPFREQIKGLSEYFQSQENKI